MGAESETMYPEEFYVSCLASRGRYEGIHV